MSSSFGIVSIVGESGDFGRDIVYVLKRYFNMNSFVFFFRLKNISMNRLLKLVVKLNKRHQPALEIKCHRRGVQPQVA